MHWQSHTESGITGESPHHRAAAGTASVAQFSEYFTDVALSKVSGYSALFRRGQMQKKVLLTFVNKDTGEAYPQQHIWDPCSTQLAEKIAKLDLRVMDFSIQFDSSELGRLELSQSGEELEELLQVGNDSSAKYVHLRVEVKEQRAVSLAKEYARTMSDRASKQVNEIASWIAGGGAMSEMTVKQAEEELLKHCRVGEPQPKVECIKVTGVDVAEWRDKVPVIAQTLGIPSDEEKLLLEAGVMDLERCSWCDSSTEGGRLKSTAVSYCTFRDEGRVFLVYGQFELSCLLLRPGACSEYAVQVGPRSFTVYPPAAPTATGAGSEVQGMKFDLPADCTVVHSTDPDISAICSRVIAPFSWGTHRIVLSDQASKTYPIHATAQGDPRTVRSLSLLPGADRSCCGISFTIKANVNLAVHAIQVVTARADSVLAVYSCEGQSFEHRSNPSAWARVSSDVTFAKEGELQLIPLSRPKHIHAGQFIGFEISADNDLGVAFGKEPDGQVFAGQADIALFPGPYSEAETPGASTSDLRCFHGIVEFSIDQSPGAQLSPDINGCMLVSSGGRSFEFTEGGYRLLVEQQPQLGPGPNARYRRYAESLAKLEWAKRLGAEVLVTEACLQAKGAGQPPPDD